MLKLLLFLVLVACDLPEPQGQPVMYDCPEVDPAQPRCKVQP